MNKHFSAILAIMDTAEIVPDEITFTSTRDIFIRSELGIFPDFRENIVRYCDENELAYSEGQHPEPYFLIKNPKNA